MALTVPCPVFVAVAQRSATAAAFTEAALAATWTTKPSCAPVAGAYGGTHPAPARFAAKRAGAAAGEITAASHAFALSLGRPWEPTSSATRCAPRENGGWHSPTVVGATHQGPVPGNARIFLKNVGTVLRMDYRPIERKTGDFQQSMSANDILAVSRAAFGAHTEVLSAIELGDGYYNNTYRVDIGQDRPVILRVAPEPSRQAQTDPELMRNEYASVPYLTPVAGLLPRILAVDFTHLVIGRDHLFQTLLDGTPAASALNSYPQWSHIAFYSDLGDITRTIHQVRGPGFGRVAGPTHERWSDALFCWFDRAAADLSRNGLETDDIAKLIEVADRNRALLDEITEPRMLHGDLWVGNTMLALDAPEPTITGVYDCDRTWWGDPEADWPIYLALRKPGSERDAFWEGYGQVGQTERARWRALVYEAKHATALLLEYKRFGLHEEIGNTYGEIRDLITRLAE
ncbi:aminoglycoside phosphotransferase family protein [Streptomyces sp. ME19-03-3]|nr:aminoglycoside phosphotransferase family protein [Streptomyces sp. ME19-03-3]